MMADSFEELKAELSQCAICLGDLRDPRCLPCLHSFCERCLKSSMHIFQQSFTTGTRSFKCPKCRVKTDIPQDGVNGFPKDFKANTILEFLKKANGYRDVPKCDVCKSKQNWVKIFCCDCRKHYCQPCENSVHTLPVFENHVTLQSSLCQESPIKECGCLSNAYISHVCNTCNVQICVSCLYNKHKHHDLVEIEHEMTTMKGDVKDKCYSLQNLILDLQKRLHILHLQGSYAENNYSNCIEHVKEQSERLQSIVKDNERRLLFEIEQIFSQTFRNLVHDQAENEHLLANSKDLLVKVYHHILHGNKQNTLERIEDVGYELERMVGLCENINLDEVNSIETQVEFTPVDNISIGVLSQHPKTEQETMNYRMADMNSVIDCTKTLIEFHDILPDIIADECHSTEQDNVSENASLRGSKEKCYNSVETIAVDTQHDTPTIPKLAYKNATSKHISDSNKTINQSIKQFTTRNIGREQRQELDDQSPYDTNSYSNMKKSKLKSSMSEKDDKQREQLSLTQPQRYQQKKHFPRVKAILMTILDKQGTHAGEINKPVSACFNKEGNVVVAELGNNRLQVFNTKGNSVNSFSQGQIAPQCVVAIDTDEYAAIDELTKSIKLINNDGELRKVQSDVSFPSALCFSSDKTLIVTDAVFDSIFKITIDGATVSKYSNQGHNLNDLDNPSAIYVTDNLTVFVADTGNHQVKFLDKNLTLMYKFGCYGNGDGQLRYPRGITGNNDMLFIADSGNNRIVMFSHSGKYNGVLLDQDCGILNPSSLCYDEKSKVLCVALPDSNEVRIYKIKAF